MANVYQSQYANLAVKALNSDSASYALTASYAMNGGGGGGSTNTGSLLTTASAAGNTITFTKGDGSTFPVTVSGGTGAPGGSDTQLQFNSASIFSGSSKLTYNYTNSTLTLTGSMFVNGAISASLGSNTVGFFGTASWANSASQASNSSNATSSSYANTASFIDIVNNTGGSGNYEVLFVVDPGSPQTIYGDSNNFYYFPATKTLTVKNFSGTSSFITASNVWGPFGSNSIQSASFALTASHALNGGGSFTSTSSIIGNGLSSSFNINHGFNTRNLHVTVYESGSNGETVYPDIRRVNANTTSIIFANPPSTDQYIVYISQ